MTMWNHIPPERLSDPGGHGGENGARVARLGTISFVRSGFARVRWDDGRVTEEWAADLCGIDEEKAA